MSHHNTEKQKPRMDEKGKPQQTPGQREQQMPGQREQQMPGQREQQAPGQREQQAPGQREQTPRQPDAASRPKAPEPGRGERSDKDSIGQPVQLDRERE